MRFPRTIPLSSASRRASYAPSLPDWSLDNHGTSVRVLEIFGPCTRLEHPISGSDANPYRALAAVLGGMAPGLSNKRDLSFPAEQGGAPYIKLYANWSRAVESFVRSSAVDDSFGKDYRHACTARRRAEIQTMSGMVADVEDKTYLNRIQAKSFRLRGRSPSISLRRTSGPHGPETSGTRSSAG